MRSGSAEDGVGILELWDTVDELSLADGWTDSVVAGSKAGVADDLVSSVAVDAVGLASSRSASAMTSRMQHTYIYIIGIQINLVPIARLQYLQGISNGDTSVLHQVIGLQIKSMALWKTAESLVH